MLKNEIQPGSTKPSVQQSPIASGFTDLGNEISRLMAVVARAEQHFAPILMAAPDCPANPPELGGARCEIHAQQCAMVGLLQQLCFRLEQIVDRSAL